MNINDLSGTELAYLGDAVMEVFVREYLLSSGVQGTWALNQKALSYVKATEQSKAVEKILPILTEEEDTVYKRARNSHVAPPPKSASACEYRRATGLEALFGWLWLTGDKERAKFLFTAAYSLCENTESEK